MSKNNKSENNTEDDLALIADDRYANNIIKIYKLEKPLKELIEAEFNKTFPQD